MKLIITFILLISFLTQAKSQIWEKVATPFEYETINYLASMNGEIFASKYDYVDSTVYNYQYSNGEWVRAIEDTIYKEFGYLYQVDQFDNRILVSCVYGVFLSDDYGENWSKILEEGSFSQDCDISPNGIFGIKKSFESHLFKYDEVKKEWKQKEDKYDTLQYFFVKQIESNSTHIFALQQKVANPTKFKDTVSGGLFASTDKGESWKKILNDSTLLSVFITDEYIMVSAKNGKLFSSDDNGKTWTENDIETEINNFSLDGDRIIALSNPAGIIESRDYGQTWQVLNKGIYNSQIYKKDDRYFLFHYNLVYESDSLFKDIRPTNFTYPDALVDRIYNHNDTLLCVGSFDRGVQYSTDLAMNWNTYYPFLEEDRVSINKIYRKNNYLFLKAPYALYSSLNNGETFEVYPIFGRYEDLILFEDKILLYGADGRVISKDYGKTLSPIDTTVIKSNYRIFKMSETKSGNILAFSTFNGVFKSSDKAVTWTKLVDSLPTDTTFASINNFYEFGKNYYAINQSPTRILKSTDKGKSWTKLEIELFNEIQYSYIEMIDENNIIVSSYGSGIKGMKLSNNQGKTWRNIEDNLPLLNENETYLYRIIGVIGKNIFVGNSTSSYSKGNLFVTTLEKLGVQTSIESEIENNYLYTYPPYPNPAKSEVKVLFYWDINLPMTTDDISIYDITGKKIDAVGKISLVKQESHYGNLIWDCSSAQPGIYLINIKHGTEEKAVKVVVE